MNNINNIKLVSKLTQMIRIRGSLTFVLVILGILSRHGLVPVRGQLVSKRTLVIAVPPKSGFTQFVNITRDSSTGQPIYGGFAIEVFNQSVANLVEDGSISYEFKSFESSVGTMNGSYDDMVKAVFNKEYDGAVGDITIRYSRTKWVDFTTAYADTGISMLIPMRQQKSKNVVNSLNSLIKEMVFGTFVVFFLSILVFLGSDVLNFIFGRTKDDTVWPPSRLGQGADQNAMLGRDAWKREMLGTVKGTRLMMLLWFVILLFLITCYATTLVSLLVRKDPIIPNKSLNHIIRTGENVGYHRGAFVFDVLKEVGISEKQLFAYDTEDALFDMFMQGAITVAIDDTRTLSIFFAQHCDNFTLLPFPGLHTSGYGFAFPKGSPLVQKVSNGILKLIDNGELGKIQAGTIGDIVTCDIDRTVDIVSDITTPYVIRIFKVCAIVCVALLAIIYALSFITSNRYCLRYLFP